MSLMRRGALFAGALYAGMLFGPGVAVETGFSDVGLGRLLQVERKPIRRLEEDEALMLAVLNGL